MKRTISKNIFSMCSVSVAVCLLSALAVFTACENNTPFDTQSPDDQPLILIPYENVTTGMVTFTQPNPETPSTDSVVVTPSAYTTVNWYFNGQLVFTGTKLNKCFPSGQYDLVIEAVTQAGKKTSRTGSFIANPFATDPYSAAPAGGRHMVPNVAAAIDGVNLAAVKEFDLTTDVEGQQVVKTIIPTTVTDTRLEFILPEMADGAYYIHLKDAAGKRYGANLMNVHNSSVVLSGFEVFVPGAEWTVQGVKLENVASVTIDETDITELTVTATSVTFTAPAAEVGEHTLSMKNADGSDVFFVTEQGLVTKATTMVNAETTLWEGPEYILWNADRVRIESDVMAQVPVGATISIYYEELPEGHEGYIENGAPNVYHKMQVTTATWATNLVDGFDVTAETPNPYSFIYTESMKTAVEGQYSMSVVGWGLFINKITYKE